MVGRPVGAVPGHRSKAWRDPPEGRQPRHPGRHRLAPRSRRAPARSSAWPGSRSAAAAASCAAQSSALEDIASGSITLAGKRGHPPDPARDAARQFSATSFADRASEGLSLNRPARGERDDGHARPRRAVVRPAAEILARAPRHRLAAQRPRLRLDGAGASRRRLLGRQPAEDDAARGLMKPFDVYPFDEPTVGIDVGAKADVYNFMKRLVEGDAASSSRPRNCRN